MANGAALALPPLGSPRATLALKRVASLRCGEQTLAGTKSDSVYESHLLLWPLRPAG